MNEVCILVRSKRERMGDGRIEHRHRWSSMSSETYEAYSVLGFIVAVALPRELSPSSKNSEGEMLQNILVSGSFK